MKPAPSDPRPPIWQMSQVLLFLFFEGFPKVKSKSATNNKKDVENNVEEISVLPPSPEAPDAEIEEAELVEIHGDVEEELDFACEDSDTEEDEFTPDFSNAAFKDGGVVTKDNQSKIIDKNKLKRQMDKYQHELREKEMKEFQDSPPEGIYLDGKKDDTLTLEKDERGVWKVVQYNEEHYTLGVEPGGQYLGHLEPDSGKAVYISDSIIKLLKDNAIEGGWKVVGSDSTSCITGNVGGVICLLEKALGRKLYWSICLLHINELPWRHLFTDLDGPTSGSNSFKGVIGKLLPEVADMEWNPGFKPISSGPGLEELPEEVFRNLSSDLKYLRLVIQAVRSGDVPDKLKSLTNGPISHARWLTLASTVCEMYMKKNKLRGKAKKNLETLVHFCVTNYAPMWFTIKSKPSIIYGPRNYFRQLQLLNYLPQKVKEIVMENTSRSAYHAHPENILLSMLADDNKDVRVKAVGEISKMRNSSDHPDKGDISVRKFIEPNLNYNCKNYYDMIDFKKVTMYEPNLTADMTLADLENIKVEKLVVKKFSNNNQGVERLVKQTSRACQRVVGWERRDGYLRASAKSRALMPKFDSKQDYHKNFE